jgi:hypothetical protein
MSKDSRNKKTNRNVLPEEVQQPSLFAYYVIAAKVAASLNIGLGHAFNHYVKPHMIVDAKLVPFTGEEQEALFGK